jgi:hypothetical protein
MKKPEIPDAGDMRFGERVRECLLILLGRRTNRIEKVFENRRTAFKVGSFTRDMTLASGSVSYVVGFKPTVLVGLFGEAATNLTSVTVGYTDFSSFGCVEINTAVPQALITTSFFGIIREGASGVLQSVNAVPVATDDGFTLAWTKAGSPTGTGTVLYLALKDWAADMVSSQGKINEILELLHGPYQ